MDSAQDGQVVLIAECQAQRLDFLRGAVRKIGYGAIFDLIPLAIGPTQEDTAIHRTVGAQAGGFDNIHSNYYNKGKSKEIQEGASKSSDYITRLLMAHNLQVFKGLDRRMGGGHPLQERGRSEDRLQIFAREVFTNERIPESDVCNKRNHDPLQQIWHRLPFEENRCKH